MPQPVRQQTSLSMALGARPMRFVRAFQNAVTPLVAVGVGASFVRQFLRVLKRYTGFDSLGSQNYWLSLNW